MAQAAEREEVDVELDLFTGSAIVTSHGSTRIGLVTCELCGATVTIDPRDDFDARKMHLTWHDSHGGI